jgi:hypothetical protein
MVDDLVLSVYPFLVKKKDLTYFNKRITPSELENNLLSLIAAFSVSSGSATSASGRVLARLKSDTQENEYLLYNHPDAQGIFRANNTLRSNQLFPADVYNLQESAWDILETFYPTDSEVKHVIGQQKANQLFNNGFYTVNNTLYIDQRILEKFNKKLLGELAELVDILDKKLNATQEEERPQGETVSSEADKAELAKQKKLAQEILVEYLKNQQAPASTRVGTTSSTQPTQSKSPSTPPAKTPPRQPLAPKTPTSPFPTPIEEESTSLFKNKPYQVVSVQAGFMYNQVVYDLMAIY